MQTKIRAQGNGMSIASVIFGIFALISALTVVFTPIFAGLSITFALLSRGDRKLATSAVAGIVLSLLALILATLIAGALISLFTSTVRELVHAFPFVAGI